MNSIKHIIDPFDLPENDEKTNPLSDNPYPSSEGWGDFSTDLVDYVIVNKNKILERIFFLEEIEKEYREYLTRSMAGGLTDIVDFAMDYPDILREKIHELKKILGE